MKECFPFFAQLDLAYPLLKYRKMRSRWGSCSQSAVVLINTELLQAKRSCIDYVLYHELCHLKHFNHSPAFYRLLSEVCADWKSRRDELNLLARF